MTHVHCGIHFHIHILRYRPNSVLPGIQGKGITNPHKGKIICKRHAELEMLFDPARLR